MAQWSGLAAISRATTTEVDHSGLSRLRHWPGHILQRHEFLCADDEAAKERVERMVDGYDVELWHRDHRIAIFRHKEPTSR
jgi:hypothetical protein